MAKILQNVYLVPGNKYLLRLTVGSSSGTTVIRYPDSNEITGIGTSKPLNEYSIFEDVFVASTYPFIEIENTSGDVNISEINLYSAENLETIENYINGDMRIDVPDETSTDTKLSPIGFPKKNFFDSPLLLEGNWNSYTDYTAGQVVRFGYTYIDFDGVSRTDVAFYKCTASNTNVTPVQLFTNSRTTTTYQAANVTLGSDTYDIGSLVPDNTIIRLHGDSVTLPLQADTNYYVIDSGLSGTTFKLSNERGGSAITLDLSFDQLEIIPTVNTDYWSKFVSFQPEFKVTYQDGNMGFWDSHRTYAAGDEVIYLDLDGNYIVYRSTVGSNLGNEPTVPDTEWESLESSRGELDEIVSTAILTDPAYTFTGDEYLNVEGHRQRNYSDKDVLNFLRSKLNSSIEFGSSDGKFMDWLNLNGQTPTVDMSSKPGTSLIIDSFGKQVGFRSVRRFGPQTNRMDSLTLAKQRMYTRWGLGNNESSTLSENSIGTKSAFVKNYPTTYNSDHIDGGAHIPNEFVGNSTSGVTFDLTVDSGSGDVAINASSFKIFDISKHFKYRNSWHNNITLDANYTGPSLDVVGRYTVNVYSTDLSSVYPTGTPIELYISGNIIKSTVDTISYSSGVNTITVVDQIDSRPQSPIELDASTDVSLASDTIAKGGLTLANGMQVELYGYALNNITGVDEFRYYYVVNVSATTFKVSLTEGGSAINLAGTASGSLLVNIVTPPSGYVTNPAVGRHHIAINHDLTASENVNYVELENDLDSLVDNDILMKVVENNTVKYYYKPLTVEVYSKSVAADSVTYEYTTGGNTYKFIYSHATTGIGSDIGDLVDAYDDILPVPLDGSEVVEDLRLLYESNFYVSYPPVAVITESEINAVADTIDLGVTPPADYTAIVVETTDWLNVDGALSSSDSIYYSYNATGTTIQLVDSLTSTTPLDIEDVGTGSVTIRARVEVANLNNGTNPLVNSKKTFVHLPTTGIKEGQEINLTVSLPVENDTARWSDSIHGIISYKNFKIQPRVCVFSGLPVCDSDYEFLYKNAFINYDSTFWNATTSAVIDALELNGTELVNDSELDFDNPYSLTDVLSRDITISGDWSLNIGGTFEFNVSDIDVAFAVTSEYELQSFDIGGEVCYIKLSTTPDSGYLAGDLVFEFPDASQVVLQSFTTNSVFVGTYIMRYNLSVVQSGGTWTFTFADSLRDDSSSVATTPVGTDLTAIDITCDSFTSASFKYVTQSISCFTIGSTTSFVGFISDTAELLNDYVTGDFPEVNSASSSTVFNQKPYELTDILSNDKRTLLASVYPTAHESYGLLMRESRNIRSVYWSIVNLPIFPAGPTHRAYTALKNAVVNSRGKDNLNYLDLAEFAITLRNTAYLGSPSYDNDVWNGSDPFSLNIFESVRPQMPRYTQYNAFSSSLNAVLFKLDTFFRDDNDLTSYVKQAEKSYIELLKFFMLGRISRHDIEDYVQTTLGNDNYDVELPLVELADSISSSTELCHLLYDEIITISNTDITGNNIDLGQAGPTVGSAIQFKTVNGIEVESTVVSAGDIYYVATVNGDVITLSDSTDSTDTLTITSAGTGNITIAYISRAKRTTDFTNLDEWLTKPVFVTNKSKLVNPVYSTNNLTVSFLDSGDTSSSDYYTNTLAGYNEEMNELKSATFSTVENDISLNSLKNPNPYESQQFSIFDVLLGKNPDDSLLYNQMTSAVYPVDIDQKYINSSSLTDTRQDYYNSLRYLFSNASNILDISGFSYGINHETQKVPMSAGLYNPISHGGFSDEITSNGSTTELYATALDSLSSNPVVNNYYTSGRSTISIYDQPVTAEYNDLLKNEFLKSYVTPFSNTLPRRFYDSFRILVKGDDSSVDSSIKAPSVLRYSIEDYITYIDSSVDVNENDFIISDNFAFINNTQAVIDVMDFNVSYKNFNTLTDNATYAKLVQSIELGGPQLNVDARYVKNLEETSESYLRVDMRFIYSESAGRWYTLNYAQSPITYLMPTIGNKALSMKAPTIKVPSAQVTADNIVGLKSFNYGITDISTTDRKSFTTTSTLDSLVKLGSVVETGSGNWVHITKISGNKINISEALPAGVSSVVIVVSDFVWNTGVYNIDYNTAVPLIRNEWKKTPYYKMSPLELNKFVYCALATYNKVGTKVGSQYTSINDEKLPSTYNVIRLSQLSVPGISDSGLMFGIPGDVHGNPSENIVGCPLPWRVYWNIRPCTCAPHASGIDIPSTSDRTSGKISNPALANMFDYPNMGSLSYRIPWDKNPNINWLEDSCIT